MTSTGVKQETKELVRDNRGWVQALMSAGYAARGAIYIIMGILALQLALGRRKGETDQAGALAEIGNKSFGKTLLIAMAVGFLAYALWHLLAAALNLQCEDSKHRALRVIRFFLYSAFAWSTLQFALNAEQQGGDKKSRDFTKRIFEWPAGRWLVAALGLVFLGMAAYSARQASGDRYKQDLKTWEMSGRDHTIIETIARVGLYARMFVFGLIGLFLLQAAWTHDAKKAKGIDDSLRTVAQAPFGKVALGALAIGLAAFGLYSLIEARYRKVMTC